MMYPAKKFVAATALAMFCWNSGARAEEAKPPTCDAPEYRQFDFWIGKWTVTEDKQPAGTNNIEADLKRCALFESWSDTAGSRGRSINFYDRNVRRWHQSWIDDRGGALELDGGLVGTSMVLEGERVDAKTNSPVRHRITWTPQPDGSVRQHWQMMKAGAAAWENVFDGLYKHSK